MAFLAIIGMIGSVATQAAGSAAAAAASVEGAQAQGEIERLNRRQQRKNFERVLEKQKPFYEAGKAAAPLFQQAINNRLDVTQSGLYKMQADMIGKSLEGAPDYIKENALEELGAKEGELAKGRLLDIQKTGLGASATAGQSAVNFGTAFAGSLNRAGTALASGTQNAATETQNIYTKAGEQLSGIPAYVSANRNYSLNSEDDFAKLPGGKTSKFTNRELMY